MTAHRASRRTIGDGGRRTGTRCDLAILGGYGDIGREAARAWLRLRAAAGEGARLRIGGRDPQAAWRCAEHLRNGSGPKAPVQIDVMAVDLFDSAALRHFASDCAAMLNCAGPSHRIGERVAHAALEAGADYIDAAGDDALHALLDPDVYLRRERRALLSAGMQPGLSGLLPRWLATYIDRPQRLTNTIGLLDRFTAVAAEDYLHGANDGTSEPLAAWRNHGRRAGALRRRREVTLPFFAAPVTLLPYLDREGERLARALSLRDADWHRAVEHGHVLAVFDRAHGLPREQAVPLLQQASLLDLAGRQPQATMLVQLDGARTSVSALLRAPGNARLSGAFAAASAQAVLHGEIPLGRHYAAMVLPPEHTMRALQDSGALTTLNRFDGPIPAPVETEEGLL